MTAACTCLANPTTARDCICRPGDLLAFHLQRTRELLSDRMCADDAAGWLHRFCPRLGGVPWDLILAGRGVDVVDEARKAGTR